MDEIGAFDAKTHFSELLRRVEAGETITITRHGRAIARLVPLTEVERTQRQAAVDALKRFARGRRLGDLSIRELREDGRS
jgi:prevent-host-death family protein